MSRPRAQVPNLFVFRNRWCFKIGSRRLTLCPLTSEQERLVEDGKKPTPTAAQHQELLLALLEEEPSRRNEWLRVDELANLYLGNREGKINATKFNFYRRTLVLFCERFGANSLLEVTPDMVQSFVGSQKMWKSFSTKRNAYKVILQCFNFAVTNRYIVQSPLVALGKMLSTDGSVVRQIERYDSGTVLRYDQTHLEDDFGKLSEVPLDLDEFAPFEISLEEFEEAWAMNHVNQRND